MCDYRNPFQDTCGINQHHPQITCVATTSHNEPGQEEQQRALLFLEEVYSISNNKFPSVN